VCVCNKNYPETTEYLVKCNSTKFQVCLLTIIIYLLMVYLIMLSGGSYNTDSLFVNNQTERI
jgi:hypothetical protein